MSAEKSDYRLGYLDAIFDEPRAKNATFMCQRGYDDGASDAEDETTTDKDES